MPDRSIRNALKQGSNGITRTRNRTTRGQRVRQNHAAVTTIETASSKSGKAPRLLTIPPTRNARLFLQDLIVDRSKSGTIEVAEPRAMQLWQAAR